MRLPDGRNVAARHKTGAPGRFDSSSTHGEPQIWGVSEAMSAIRVPRTRRENTVQQRDATLLGGDLDPGPGCTWTRTCWPATPW